MIRYYDYIAAGYETTEEEAKNIDRQLDWSGVTTTIKNGAYPYLRYIDTVNGIDIYLNYGTDSYYFVDATVDLDKEFDCAVLHITDEMIEDLVHGDEAKLNDMFSLYKYLEEDIVVVVLTDEWTEVATVLRDGEGFIYDMAI